MRLVAAGGARSGTLAIGILFSSALFACGPNITDAYMAKDSSGSTKTTEFDSEGEEIFVIIKLTGGNEETTLNLTIDGPAGVSFEDDTIFPRPNSESNGPVDLGIQLIQYDQDGNAYGDGPWPVGNYDVGITLEDEFDQSLQFVIE